MGKEVKLGLAVIVGLFVVLGGVITVRLASLGGAGESAFAENASNDTATGTETPAKTPAANSAAKPGGDAPRDAEPARKPAATVAQKPTMLSPEDPEPSAGGGIRWGELAVERGPAEGDTDPKPAPSDPPQPDAPPAESGGAGAAPPPPDWGAGFAVASTERGAGQAYEPAPADQFAPPRYETAPVRPFGSPDDPAGNPGGQAGYMPRQPSGPSVAAREISDTRLDPDRTTDRRDDGTYEVQPNDSFWTISEKLYGTGAYFRALAKHNRRKVTDQNRLQVGQVIEAPDVAELEAKYPAYCPRPEHRHVARHQPASLPAGRHDAGAVYTVVEGDTLYRIARYELGDASRWYEIYKLNREMIGESFNHLRPGTRLVLPEDQAAGPADTLTRRPGSLY